MSDLTQQELRIGRAMLARAFESVPDGDITRLESEISSQALSAVLNASGPTMDPRFLTLVSKNRRLRQQLPRATAPALVDYFQPLRVQAASILDETQFQDPSVDDLKYLRDQLEQQWSSSTIRAFLAATAVSHFPASRNALILLQETEPEADKSEEILAEPPLATEDAPDGSDRLAPIPLPSLDNDIYTPLGRLFIKQAIATAHEQVDALTRDELAVAIDELLKLNGARPQTWFLAGFAIGLGIAPEGLFGADESVNEERRHWRLWGQLKGLERLGSVAAATKLLRMARSESIKMFENQLAPELAPFVVHALLGSDDEFALELIRTIPIDEARPIRYEHELWRIVDDHSVALLRQNNASAAVVLLRTTMERLKRCEDIYGHERRWQLQLAELRIRLSMGLAAGLRAQGNFDEALEVLKSCPTDSVALTSPRTQARFHTQMLLSLTKLRRVEDIPLPRTPVESKAFFKQFSDHEHHLQAALKANPNASDAQYLLAGIAIAQSDFQTALLHLGHCRTGYESRPDRAVMLGRVTWSQLLLKLLHDTSSTATQAMADLASSIPADIKILSSEADALIECLDARDPSLFPILTEILAASRHELPSDNSITTLLLDTENPSDDMIRVLCKISNPTRRLAALVDAFDVFSERGTTAQLEQVLDEIDKVRESGTTDVRVAWADCLTHSRALRAYLGNSEADVLAIGELAATEDRAVAPQRIREIAFAMPPVTSEESAAQWQEIVRTLRPLNSEIADAVARDPRGNLPSTYSGYIPREKPTPNSTSPATVLFVGGTSEELTETIEGVRRTLATDYPEISLISVHPGFSTRWRPYLEQVERYLPQVDAVVTTTLMPTNFGHALRRSIRNAGKYRAGTSTPGQVGITNAVLQAVEMSQRQNAQA